MAAMTVYTGFVVWVIEHEKNEEFRGSPARQMGTILWFSFSTLVFAHSKEMNHSHTEKSLRTDSLVREITHGKELNYLII